jgi:hypothetical protein
MPLGHSPQDSVGKFAPLPRSSYDRCMYRALLVVLLAGSAQAQTPQPKTPKRPVPPPTGTTKTERVPVDPGPHREGEYGGVVPGQPTNNPGGKPGKPKRMPPKGTLSWIGFEAKDGGAQLFFQSVAPFDISQHFEGATLVVHLSLRRLGQNTWRQIDTRFFDNPLAMVIARAVGASRATKSRPATGAGIDVRITFKNSKDAHEGTVQASKAEADGMVYAYVTFPEGADSKTTQPTMQDPEQ